MASNNQGGNQSNQREQGNQGTDKGSKQGDMSSRGFASMGKDMQRNIASKGGCSAYESGNANEFTSEEAHGAGHKGGEASSGGNGGKQAGQIGSGNNQDGSSGVSQGFGGNQGSRVALAVVNLC